MYSKHRGEASPCFASQTLARTREKAAQVEISLELTTIRLRLEFAPATRGGFMGGGSVVIVLPQEFDPLPTQRVHPLYYFEISTFG